MDCQQNNGTAAALGLCVNEEKIADKTLIRLAPNELEFLETMGDIVEASGLRKNVYLVPKKPSTIIEENGTDVCDGEYMRPTTKMSNPLTATL